jgi:hypothetical protein
MSSSTYRRRVRATSWVLGCLGMSGSVGLYGYISHAKGLEKHEIADL